MDEQPQGSSPANNDVEIASKLEAYHQNMSGQGTAETPPVQPAEQPPAPMPSANETPEEEQGPAQEAETPSGGTDDEEREALENSKNPERTRQYIEKLKKQISKPQAEPRSIPDGSSIFDTFRPQVPPVQVPQVPVQPVTPNLTNQQVEAIKQQFVSEDGELDVERFNQALVEYDQRTRRAEEVARSAEERVVRLEEDRQVREAHAVYPELSPRNEQGQPNEKFDPDFFEMVRDRLVRHWAEGQNKSLLQVANDIRRVYKPSAPVNPEKIRDEAVAQYKEAQDKRNQGPVEPGRGQSREAVDHQELRQRSLKGDDSAVAQRLRKVGVF